MRRKQVVIGLAIAFQIAVVASMAISRIAVQTSSTWGRNVELSVRITKKAATVSASAPPSTQPRRRTATVATPR